MKNELNLVKAAKAINAYVSRGNDAGREYFIEAGVRLIEVRAATTAKFFRGWVENNIKVGFRQAERYMSYARDEAKLAKDRSRNARAVAKHRNKNTDLRKSADILPFTRPSLPVTRATRPMGDKLEGNREEKAGRFQNMIREAGRLAVFVEDLSSLAHFDTLADDATLTGEVWIDVGKKLRKLAESERAKKAARPA